MYRLNEKNKYRDAQVQTAFYPRNTSAINKHIHNTKEIKQCINEKVINTINKTSKVATRSAQTIDVYKSVQVQTKLCDVGSNTMSEKATNTNQSVSYSSVRFKNKLYADVEYDINNLMRSTTTIRSTNNYQTNIKD